MMEDKNTVRYLMLKGVVCKDCVELFPNICDKHKTKDEILRRSQILEMLKGETK